MQCFEQGDGVGGTWYWNRYPGARSTRRARSTGTPSPMTCRLVDGRDYVLEGKARGTNGTAVGERGRPYVLEFICIGSFDDDGRVQEQRDYWDVKSWLLQIGADEAI